MIIKALSHLFGLIFQFYFPLNPICTMFSVRPRLNPLVKLWEISIKSFPKQETQSSFLLWHCLNEFFCPQDTAKVCAKELITPFLLPFFLFEADFFVGKKLQLPSFRDCLRERGTVQMLTIGREAAIEVQVEL